MPRQDRWARLRRSAACAASALVFGFAAPALASPAFDPGPSGYLSIAVLASRNSFGLDYTRLENGSATAKLQNGFGLGSTSALPWYAAGLRLTDRAAVGAEYLAYASDSTGTAEAKVRFGPFRFFVGTPADFAYLADVARGWVSYEIMESGAANFAVYGGVTVARLQLSANANGLGGKSEQGIIGMPTAGVRLRYGDIQALRFAVSADYSYANIAKVQGRALDVSLVAERILWRGIVLGAGYRYYELRLDTTQPLYDAHFTSGIQGPFVSARWRF